MAFTKDENELGALWEKTSAKGPYMTGSITVDGVEVRVVCFRAKPSERGPTWRVMKSQPKAPAVPQDGGDF